MSYGPTLAVGAKYGRLTILDGPMRKGPSNWYGYRCVCDCGKETFARATGLKTGRHMSCGCQMRERAAARWEKPGATAVINSVFKNYKAAAPRRRYGFHLTRGEFQGLIAKPCRYCGAPPATAPARSSLQRLKVKDVTGFRYNGIDRVDNTKGYTVANCVPCCATCNRAKASMTVPEWTDWVHRVYKGMRESSMEAPPRANLLLMTDSYKHAHWALYPKGTETVYSYFESRGGKWPEVVFFGLQGILQRYFAGVCVTEKDIAEAETLLDAHFGHRLFNKAGWEHIARDHRGLLPLSIHAVPEGTSVPVSNVLMTIENTCPKCFWLTNFAETVAVEAWYPSTVCTISRAAKRIILRYLERTGDPGLIDFKLHDFGFRGSTSPESAAIGGCAHLVNFKGTDTLAALVYARDYYHEPCAGFSIPATEHSVMTINGPDGELGQMRALIHAYPTGLAACVVDSYDTWAAVSEKLGRTLRAEILARDGTLVVRPDSGYPPKVVREIVERLSMAFGSTMNAKGYRVLDPHVRVIQGDGVNLDTIEECLHQLQDGGWSADNLAFGMGGALLQRCDRDTQQFAFKCSWRSIDGAGESVYKSPALDPAKNSKRGRLALIELDGHYQTVPQGGVAANNDRLVEVFRDGYLLKDYSLAEIRQRAALTDTPLALTQ